MKEMKESAIRQRKSSKLEGQLSTRTERHGTGGLFLQKGTGITLYSPNPLMRTPAENDGSPGQYTHVTERQVLRRAEESKQDRDCFGPTNDSRSSRDT